MGIITTPIYGIEAPDDLEPIFTGAGTMRRNAATIEAALKRGGIAPPAAQDLATLAGRVTALEGWDVAPVALTLTGSFANFGAGFQPLRVFRVSRYLAGMAGLIRPVAAVAGLQSLTVVNPGGIPAALRPVGGYVMAPLLTGQSGTALLDRLDVYTDGRVQLEHVNNAATPAGTYMGVNFVWPIAA